MADTRASLAAVAEFDRTIAASEELLQSFVVPLARREEIHVFFEKIEEFCRDRGMRRANDARGRRFPATVILFDYFIGIDASGPLLSIENLGHLLEINVAVYSRRGEESSSQAGKELLLMLKQFLSINGFSAKG